MRWFLLLVACITIAIVATAEPIEKEERTLTPAEVLLMATADLISQVEVVGQDGKKVSLPVIDPTTAQYTRYISVHNLPAKERQEAMKVISGHLHQLSRKKGLAPLIDAKDWHAGDRAIVKINDVLLRINTQDFGDLFTKKFEELGTVEPYFHADDEGIEEVYEDVEYGFWVKSDGTKYTGRQQNKQDVWEKTGTVREKVKKPKRGLAPWLIETEEGKKALEVFQAKTGGTDTPIVTAEWLLSQTAVQFKRDPLGYYDFLGIKDLKTYEKVIGFVDDPKAIDVEFLKELREVTANSEVTGPDVLRRIVRFEKIGGGYWFTQDSNQRQAENNAKANPLTNLGDDYEFQAAETFGHLPNDFWATGLFNNKGVRQDVAPDFIASDNTAPYADRRVHVNLGCLRCHSDGGLKEVDGWVRNVLNNPPNYLANANDKVVHKLREQYVEQHIAPYLKTDRQRYANALWAVNGMKPKEYADAYGTLWKRYTEDPVDVNRAARDLGTTPVKFQKALADLGPKCDPSLASFRLPNPKPIPAIIWVRSFQNAQDALRGISRNVGVLKQGKP